MEAPEAIINADSFTYYGVVAKLRELGTELADDDERAQDGFLQAVPVAGTKRGLLHPLDPLLEMRSHARQLNTSSFVGAVLGKPILVGGARPDDILPQSQASRLQHDIILDIE